MLEKIDLDITEVPIVSTAPVNKQLNNESESPIIEIANAKEIDDDSSNRNHTDNLSQQSYDNNSIINSISNGDIKKVSLLSKRQKIPVRITQRCHRKKKRRIKLVPLRVIDWGFTPTDQWFGSII
jgi:hypothetical protein